MTGPDRQRADAAGQLITPVPGLASTTAAGLARRFNAAQWQAVERGVAVVTGRMLSLLPAERVTALADGPVTIDLDTDSKLGAALRHLPSGYPQVNLAWMWGALLTAAMAAWLHQLTAATAGEDILAGRGVRGGKAMIATLRWRLIAVPGRLIRHARHLMLRLSPGHYLLPEILARLRDLPAPAWPAPPELRLPVLAHGPPAPIRRRARTSRTRRNSRAISVPATRNPGTSRSFTEAG